MNAAQLINQTSGDVEYYTPAFIIEAARAVLGGRIELDPASCDFANQTVQAGRIFTDPGMVQIGELTSWVKLKNGDKELTEVKLPLMEAKPGGAFAEEWAAETAWMNHPFGQPEFQCVANCQKKGCQKRGWHLAGYRHGNGDWIDRMVNAVRANQIGSALCITFAATSETWFGPLLNNAQCYLRPRTNYIGRDGKPVPGVTKGSVVTLLGGSRASLLSFMDHFHDKFGTVKI